MFTEPTITWVHSGFSGYIWLDTKIVFKKVTFTFTEPLNKAVDTQQIGGCSFELCSRPPAPYQWQPPEMCHNLANQDICGAVHI